MSAPALDFEIYQGDTTKLRVSVVDSDDAVFNLTGCTIRWWFSKQTASNPYVFSKTALITKSIGSGITVISAIAGTLTIDLASIDTRTLKGDFYHELEVVDSLGQIQTVLNGTMTILEALITNS